MDMPSGRTKTLRARAKPMAASKESRFTFINLSHPDELKDENTISRVRRLAMAHVGKARKIRNTHNNRFQDVFELDQPRRSLPETIALSRVGLDTLDPFASYPFNMGSHASQLCDNFFRTNQGYSVALRNAWSFAGFYDDLAFQTFLSTAALYLQTLRTGKLLIGDTTESLQLHIKAIRLLRQRLDNPDQHASDGLIGGMSGFMIYDVS
ncbi:Nn.00g045660.m01.CDS01 [Neocucurbitaria sp. VM-36]